MAKNRSSSRTNDNKVAFGDYWFVSLEFQAGDKEDFQEWDGTGESSADYLDTILAEGCKVSFTIDERGGGVLCSASQQRADSENAGGILTGRGPDAATALRVLQYKDIVLASSGNWKQAAHERGQSRLDIG